MEHPIYCIDNQTARNFLEIKESFHPYFTRIKRKHSEENKIKENKSGQAPLLCNRNLSVLNFQCVKLIICL